MCKRFEDVEVYLGLLLLDRAEECSNEAEKFKICLQKNDHDHAIFLMQAMLSCLDFTTDFISQADHEAVSSCALPVATASLEPCLSFVGQKGGETGTSKEMRGFSLPEELIEQILVRTRFIHPQSKQVSKHFNEMLLSDKHFKKRKIEGHQEASMYFCIRTYNSFPSAIEYHWYTEVKVGQGCECRRLSRMPEQREGLSVVGVGSYIYVMGGIGEETDLQEETVLFIFDGRRNRWHIGSPMNACRYNAACIVWDDTIYIFGGGGIMWHSYWVEKYIIQSGSRKDVMAAYS